MATPEAFDAIKETLDFSWSETDIAYENDGFEPPDTQEPFVYVEVVGDVIEQDTFGDPGANEWVEEGAVYLHVMVPNGTGSRDARGIAKRLTDLFREVPIGTMHFERMSIGSGDPGRNFPNFWAMTASIGWYRRDITGT